TAIPNRRYGHIKETSTPDIGSGAHNPGANRRDHLVFVCYAQQVQCPEDFIPSLVRLESSQERMNLLRDILGSSLDGAVQFAGIPRKLEIGLSSYDLARQSFDGVANVLQGGADI